MSGPGGVPVGVVLAGGASRRMGRDKATLRVAGVTLAERAAALLAGVCAEVVVADGGRGLVPDRPSCADGSADGPAAGILGAAAARPGWDLLVLACDLPAVPPALLAELASPVPCDWRVPRWKRGLEPLCALYRPAALAALGELVASGVRAPHRLAGFPGLAVLFLEGAALARFGDPARLFRNLNTPQDLAALAE